MTDVTVQVVEVPLQTWQALVDVCRASTDANVAREAERAALAAGVLSVNRDRLTVGSPTVLLPGGAA